MAQKKMWSGIFFGAVMIIALTILLGEAANAATPTTFSKEPPNAEMEEFPDFLKPLSEAQQIFLNLRPEVLDYPMWVQKLHRSTGKWVGEWIQPINPKLLPTVIFVDGRGVPRYLALHGHRIVASPEKRFPVEEAAEPNYPVQNSAIPVTFEMSDGQFYRLLTRGVIAGIIILIFFVAFISTIRTVTASEKKSHNEGDPILKQQLQELNERCKNIQRWILSQGQLLEDLLGELTRVTVKVSPGGGIEVTAVAPGVSEESVPDAREKIEAAFDRYHKAVVAACERLEEFLKDAAPKAPSS